MSDHFEQPRPDGDECPMSSTSDFLPEEGLHKAHLFFSALALLASSKRHLEIIDALSPRSQQGAFCVMRRVAAMAQERSCSVEILFGPSFEK